MTDRAAYSEKKFFRRLQQILTAGIDWIQIREKGVPTDELVRLSEKVLRLPRRRSQKIFLNDRLDIAVACGFDGVHLGGASFPVEAVRRRVPDHFVVGVSTHHRLEAVTAEREGANYVIFGPVFETPSKKKYGAPQGVARLREVAEALSIPVIAIGGISLENFEECRAAGASGIAAISLFQDSPSVRRVLARLRKSSWSPPRWIAGPTRA